MTLSYASVLNKDKAQHVDLFMVLAATRAFKLLCDYGLEAIHWNPVGSLVARQLKTIIAPPQESIWASLWCRPIAGRHTCYEVKTTLDS